jgi:hypothetical protein
MQLLAVGQGVREISGATNRYQVAEPSAPARLGPAGGPDPLAPAPCGASARQTDGVLFDLPAPPKVVGGARSALKSAIQGPIFSRAATARKTGRKSAPLRFEPPAHGRMIQTELSLDQVRVVRNDLSESDLEIVPASAAVPLTEAVDAAPRLASPAPASGASESLWQRWAGQLAGWWRRPRD